MKNVYPAAHRSAHRVRHTGGPRISPDLRATIVALYLRDPKAATDYAVGLGLRSDYAYRVTYERGLLPRASRYWGRLQENVA